MSRRKKGGGGEECGSWMDTYGDMVTLLMCFFVMLYSMSSLDQQKWQIFVKSIFPNSNEKEEIAINENISEGVYDVSGNLQTEQEIEDETLDELWLSLVSALNLNGIDGVSVSRGEGYTFVSFENQAFFSGDSSALTNEATRILDIFCDVLAPQTDLISQIEIMGHTAQGDPNRPNDVRTDRMLSSLRSAEVTAYIQAKNIIDPSKLVGISYGQFRPVDTFETQEGRAKNRRVEFLIVDAGADIKSMNDYYDEYNDRMQEGAVTITDGIGTEHQDGHGFTPVDGSMEGAASMVPEVDEPAQGVEAPEPAANPLE